MKPKEAMEVLRVSRPTLKKLEEEGKIKSVRLSNNYREYDDDSIYAFLNRGVKRKTVIYGRASKSCRGEIETQLKNLQQFCFERGYIVSGVYRDIANGLDFEKRNDLLKLFDEVCTGKVERVVIAYKDRLSRVDFELFRYIFDKYRCEIVVMSEIGNPELDDEDVFEDIVYLLQCYSTNLYTKRKNEKIKKLIKKEEDTQNQI